MVEAPAKGNDFKTAAKNTSTGSNLDIVVLKCKSEIDLKTPAPVEV